MGSAIFLLPVRNKMAGRMEQFGSRVIECGLDTMLEFVLRKESTSGCGPNENDEPIEPQWCELILEGDGWGMLHTRILDLVDEKLLKSLIGSSTQII